MREGDKMLIRHPDGTETIATVCFVSPGYAADVARHQAASREPRMCQACYEGDHVNCGMQTWCECDCAGRDGTYDYPDPDEAGGSRTPE